MKHRDECQEFPLEVTFPDKKARFIPRKFEQSVVLMTDIKNRKRPCLQAESTDPEGTIIKLADTSYQMLEQGLDLVMDYCQPPSTSAIPARGGKYSGEEPGTSGSANILPGGRAFFSNVINKDGTLKPNIKRKELTEYVPKLNALGSGILQGVTLPFLFYDFTRNAANPIFCDFISLYWLSGLGHGEMGLSISYPPNLSEASLSAARLSLTLSYNSQYSISQEKKEYTISLASFKQASNTYTTPGGKTVFYAKGTDLFSASGFLISFCLSCLGDTGRGTY
ncbi:MAG: hypothetical protein MI784_05895, partial [Cytophagales bacterium]|nr:hypothetical protein [Cytophagales bacterium]